MKLAEEASGCLEVKGFYEGIHCRRGQGGEELELLLGTNGACYKVVCMVRYMCPVRHTFWGRIGSISGGGRLRATE